MAKLTTKKRKNLPSGDFAVKGRKYPVNDANHARNALARVAQHGSPAEKAAVRAKVAKKFPGIDEGEKKGKTMKKSVAKEHEAKGEKKHDRKERTDRKHESKGMKLHMGDGGKHDAVGEHEGRLLGMKKKR